MRMLPALLLLATLAPAQKLEFEVATIKLNTSVPNIIRMTMPAGGHFRYPLTTLQALIGRAYDLQSYRILDGPSWIASNRYDVEAKSGDPDPSAADVRFMMQSLLADRFQLKVHTETRQLPAYTLGRPASTAPGFRSPTRSTVSPPAPASSLAPPPRRCLHQASPSIPWPSAEAFPSP